MRRPSWLAVGAILLVVLAGCSSRDDASGTSRSTAAPIAATPGVAATSQATRQAVERSPEEVLAAAPERVAEAGSARFDLSGTVTDDESTTPVELTGEGASDYTTGRTRMRLDVGEQSPSGEPIEFVSEGARFFVAASSLGLPLPDGVRWLALDLDTAEQEGAAAPPGLAFLESGADPTAALEVLRGATGDIEVVGEEEVRGVATTHYRTMVERDLAALAADPAVAERLETSELPPAYPVDVWIDDEGLPLRVEFAPAGDSGPASDQFTLDFFDYGEDVGIEIPDAAEVLDLQELFGGLESGTG